MELLFSRDVGEGHLFFRFLSLFSIVSKLEGVGGRALLWGWVWCRVVVLQEGSGVKVVDERLGGFRFLSLFSILSKLEGVGGCAL